MYPSPLYFDSFCKRVKVTIAFSFIVLMDDDDEKEKDISDDENYTGDGEDAYEENNFD